MEIKAEIVFDIIPEKLIWPDDGHLKAHITDGVNLHKTIEVKSVKLFGSIEKKEESNVSKN